MDFLTSPKNYEMNLLFSRSIRFSSKSIYIYLKNSKRPRIRTKRFLGVTRVSLLFEIEIPKFALHVAWKRASK